MIRSASSALLLLLLAEKIIPKFLHGMAFTKTMKTSI